MGERAERDFELAAEVPRLFYGGKAREIGERFSDLAMTVQSFMLDYRPDMTEAELRAWAEQFRAAVS